MKPVPFATLVLTYLIATGIAEEAFDKDLAHIENLISTIEHVHQTHPETEKLEYERLVNHALEGVLSSLDRFSYYYHPETSRALESDASLNLEIPGLGLSVAQRASGLYILAVTDFSAAGEAGIQPGDSLVSISELGTINLPLADAIQHLSGAPGDVRALNLVSENTREPYSVKLITRAYRTKPLSTSHMLTDKVTGYIHLAQFSAGADIQLAAALDDLEARGMKQLVLDMRGNPGGQLDTAVAILGEFVPASTEVVTTQARQDTDLKASFTTPARKRRPRDYPVAALIDRNSASAAELVPGALQDLERATIIGETSYGKGSVQNVQRLRNGAALRLTIATYHTPSGKTPHNVGITPDISVSLSNKDRENTSINHRRASASPADRAKLESWEDPVIKAALTHFQKSQ